MTKAKPAEDNLLGHFRVTLKESLRVGSVTLRPGQPHVISGRVLAAAKDKVESYEAI